LGTVREVEEMPGRKAQSPLQRMKDLVSKSDELLENVTEYHVWDYDPDRDRIVYRGTDPNSYTSQINRMHITQEQHDKILAADDTTLELKERHR
jgi:hypothetical protein